MWCDDETQIALFEKPSRRYTPYASDFFCRKKFHSINVQAVCDMDRVFWNVCAGQPGGVHDGGQFQWSSLYTQLKTRAILREPLLHIGNQEVRPYLLEDSAYPIRPLLLKNFKPGNSDFRDQIRFDSSMNSDRVVIENAFAGLKNRW